MKRLTKMKKNFIEELRWRGMLHDAMPGTEEQLNKEMTVGYIGFDPTADSIHIGNLATLMMLKHLQMAGHKPVALVGGATGMVGDPSGKSAERNLLDVKTLRHNEQAIGKQLAKFLDFDCGENSAELLNNYDWFGQMNFLEFLRDVGKHLTINYMTAKDSVKKRLESGLSFTEFSYQLLQGYDFFWLNKNKNCKIQMGGSDQWGNITTGTELIRRMGGGDAFAVTCPLITKADGSKFGKSVGGNVWLDPKRTSPYKFYQFWLNVDDTETSKLLRVFTLLDKETIEKHETDYANDPRMLKRILAEEVTRMVHSQEELERAQKASGLLFGKSTLDDFESTDEDTLLDVFEGIPKKNYTQDEFAAFESTVDLVANAMTEDEAKPVSKSEVRRLIKNNGIKINQKAITKDQGESKPEFGLLKDKFLLIKKGKKYFLVTVGVVKRAAEVEV
jgi:tyrosyl-tRNA synthetase